MIRYVDLIKIIKKKCVLYYEKARHLKNDLIELNEQCISLKVYSIFIKTIFLSYFKS